MLRIEITIVIILGSTAQDSDVQDDHLPRSFVPFLSPSFTEEEAVRHSVQQRQQASSTLMWPSIGGTPINEFTTEGYFSCAFPTLFPTGDAEFLGGRLNPITIGNYFKHLMMYNDGRFAKHPRFRYFALNTEMRWRALQTGRIYVRQHPGDAQLSLDELRDMVGREGETFPTVCCIMLPVCVVLGSIGFASEADSCQWLTHLAFPGSSSHTVPKISSGPNWLISSAQILSQGPAAPQQSSRIQPLLTGSFPTLSRSSLMHFIVAS